LFFVGYITFASLVDRLVDCGIQQFASSNSMSLMANAMAQRNKLICEPAGIEEKEMDAFLTDCMIHPSLSPIYSSALLVIQLTLGGLVL
jgi:hypothetical protein